jgi:site-specific recombinase XerD
MPKHIDPARACLHVRDWPAADQALWNEVVHGDDYDNEAVEHPNWRLRTVQANREGYGRWINELIRSGVDLTGAPSERVTGQRVKAYVMALRSQGLAPQTIANRISQLLSVMLVFAPKQDWDWLRQMFNRNAIIANHSRKPRPLTVLSGDILHPALRRMAQIQRTGCAANQVALEYRNWLMLVMLVFTALRIDNFACLSIGVHLKRINEEWMIEIPADRAKQKKRIRMPVPTDLDPHLDFYLQHVRPRLLAGRSSDRLWISNCHTAMGAHSIYIAVTNFTKEQFGEAINPHRFRHIAATSNVIGAPEQTEA